MSDCYDDPICKECGTDTAAVEQMLREAQERCERLEGAGRNLLLSADAAWKVGHLSGSGHDFPEALESMRAALSELDKPCDCHAPDACTYAQRCLQSEPDEMTQAMQEGKV